MGAFDFKLEFRRLKKNGKSQIMLADEISPDTCRLWDVVSKKKLDKDRLRKDLGNIIQAYQDSCGKTWDYERKR